MQRAQYLCADIEAKIFEMNQALAEGWPLGPMVKKGMVKEGNKKGKFILNVIEQMANNVVTKMEPERAFREADNFVRYNYRAVEYTAVDV